VTNSVDILEIGIKVTVSSSKDFLDTSMHLWMICDY